MYICKKITHFKVTKANMPDSIKNITPSKLALLTALACGAGTFFVAFMLLALFNPTLQVWGLLCVMINIIFCYVLFYAALERFIHRKVKVIYKNIRRFKQPQGIVPEKTNMNRGILEEVESEVLNWADEQSSEIEQLKKMESYRREFLGNVSHELKTPLFNIQGYLDTLLDGGIDDPKINLEYVHKAAKNVERLINIVKDLDVISQHESGQLEMKWEKFKIYELVKEVFDSFEMLADANDITLCFKEGSAAGTIVYADREKIRQVLTNLISNSIKYGREHGKTAVGIYDMDKLALIEVSDNGIGIESRHLPRLFERFYRIDPSRSRTLGGSGLGLAIVKHIIEAHNQTIHVRSTPGVGTTFGFTLVKG